jgi:hypothetical protein
MNWLRWLGLAWQQEVVIGQKQERRRGSWKPSNMRWKDAAI